MKFIFLRKFFNFLITFIFICISIYIIIILNFLIIIKYLDELSYIVIFKLFDKFLHYDTLLVLNGELFGKTAFLNQLLNLFELFYKSFNTYNTNILQLNKLNFENLTNYKIYSAYYDIVFFIILCIIISMIFFFLSYSFFIKPTRYNEKLLPYECGFDPFGDARKEFNIQFYLVAIFFIIFDIESVFVFPWVVSFYELNNFGFLNMIDFLIELVIGYFYIIRTKSLDWSKYKYYTIHEFSKEKL